MRQLEELLSDISPSEREEALQYYNDYFNDAGRENEEEVIVALGTPEQVARIVKDGLGENSGAGEFTETGYQSGRPLQNEVMKTGQPSGQSSAGTRGGNGVYTEAQSTNSGSAGVHGANAGYTGAQGSNGTYAGAQGANAGYTGAQGTNSSYAGAQAAAGKKEGMPVWAIILIVIGCIFLSPFILTLVLSAAAALLGVICAIIGVIAGFGLAALVLFTVAIALIIAGFGCMLPHPVSGIGLIGGGLICAAIGILFLLLTVFLAGKCVPGICQGIAYIWKKLFGKKGGV